MLEQEIQQLKNLMKQNLELTHELEAEMRKVKNYLFWAKVWSWVKLALIMVPIILALIYLPPIIREALDEYYGVIGGFQANLPSGLLNSLK
jgi:hypothetical protein